MSRPFLCVTAWCGLSGDGCEIECDARRDTLANLASAAHGDVVTTDYSRRIA